jgi:hypothetical protein
MCETKQQVCYSKKTTNAAGEKYKKTKFFFILNISSYIGKLLQFSRGCSMPPPSPGNLTQQPQCLTSKQEGKTICVKYCQANLCNHQDIRFKINNIKDLYLFWFLFFYLAMALWPLQSHELYTSYITF